jgi:hypothetical protein
MTQGVSGVFVPTRYVREVELAPAHLLAQIIYWFTKASNGASHFIVYRFGHRWLAHSREQLMEETGLTPSQIKAALRRLADQRIIVTEQHLFGSKNISHIRMHNDCPTWVGEGFPVGMELSDLLETAKKANSIIGKTQIKNNSDSSASGAFLLSEKDQKIGKKAISASEPAIEEVGSAALGQRFISSYAETYPDEFLPPLTNKQLGQLKLFSQSCPAGSAGKVLDWCVRNWSLFTSYAESDQGAFRRPKRPTTGYLLQYIQTAVNAYMVSTAASKAKPKLPKYNPPPTSEPVVAPPLSSEDKLVTLEEMEELLGLSGEP